MIAPVASSSAWSPAVSPSGSADKITQVSLPRLKAACRTCSSLHIKCDATPPREPGPAEESCTRCVTNNLSCFFDSRKALPSSPPPEEELQFPMDDLEPLSNNSAEDIFYFGTPPELQYLEDFGQIPRRTSPDASNSPRAIYGNVRVERSGDP